MSDDSDDLDGQVDSARRRIGAEFLAAVAWFRDQISEDEAAKLVAMGQGADLAADASRLGARLADVINGAQIDAARETVDAVSKVIGSLSAFPAHGAAATAQARATEQALVDGFVAEQTTLLHDLLFDAASRSLGPTATARELVDSLGLTPQMVDWVDSYRRLLERGSASALDRELRDRRHDPSVERAASGRGPMSPRTIDTMVDRYRRRLLMFRAETLSITQARRAVNAGRQLALEDMIQRGEIDGADVTRIWLHRDPQKHPRDFHQSMHGQERAVDEPFVSGLGNLLMFPGDPDAGPEETYRCQCGLRIVIAARAVRSAA